MKSSPLKHTGKHPADQYIPNPGHMPHDHKGGNVVYDDMGTNIVTGENQTAIIASKAAEVDLAYKLADRSLKIKNNATITLNNFGKIVQEVIDDPETTIQERKTKIGQYYKGEKALDSLDKEYKFNIKNLSIAQEQYTNTLDSIYEVNLPLHAIDKQRNELEVGSYEEQDQLTLQQDAYIAMSPRERMEYVIKKYKY